MNDMDDWENKDDLDLTAEDLRAMTLASSPVEAAGPRHLPEGAMIGRPIASYGVGRISRSVSPSTFNVQISRAATV